MAWIVLSTRNGEQNVEFATVNFGELKKWLRLHFRDDTVVRRVHPAERDAFHFDQADAADDQDGQQVLIGIADDNLESTSPPTCGLPT